jgi:hypothetical protein
VLSVRWIEQRSPDELALAQLAPELAVGVNVGRDGLLGRDGMLLATGSYALTGPMIGCELGRPRAAFPDKGGQTEMVVTVPVRLSFFTH